MTQPEEWITSYGQLSDYLRERHGIDKSPSALSSANLYARQATGRSGLMPVGEAVGSRGRRWRHAEIDAWARGEQPPALPRPDGERWLDSYQELADYLAERHGWSTDVQNLTSMVTHARDRVAAREERPGDIPLPEKVGYTSRWRASVIDEWRRRAQPRRALAVSLDWGLAYLEPLHEAGVTSQAEYVTLRRRLESGVRAPDR